MLNPNILITVGFAVMLYAGARILHRKRYYRDFVWYVCILGWAFVIMLAYVQKLPMASQITSIALFKQCVKPFSQQLLPIMNLEFE